MIEEGFWRSEASLEQSSVSREGEVQVGGSRKCRSVPRVAGVRSSSGNKVDEDNTRKSGRVRCGKSWMLRILDFILAHRNRCNILNKRVIWGNGGYENHSAGGVKAGLIWGTLVEELVGRLKGVQDMRNGAGGKGKNRTDERETTWNESIGFCEWLDLGVNRKESKPILRFQTQIIKRMWNWKEMLHFEKEIMAEYYYMTGSS